MPPKRVLIWVAPLYEDLELWYPRIRLEEEGAVVTVAGLDRELCRGKHGYPCKPDATADEVDPDAFDALVIPGGFAPDKLRRSARVLEVTRRIFEAGKPVGFICHAGWVPISARIVKGRRGTSVGAIRDDLENAGLIWEDSPVVVDGNLVSSRNPGDLPAFMKALIALMA